MSTIRITLQLGQEFPWIVIHLTNKNGLVVAELKQAEFEHLEDAIEALKLLNSLLSHFQRRETE